MVNDQLALDEDERKENNEKKEASQQVIKKHYNSKYPEIKPRLKYRDTLITCAYEATIPTLAALFRSAPASRSNASTSTCPLAAAPHAGVDPFFDVKTAERKEETMVYSCEIKN